MNPKKIAIKRALWYLSISRNALVVISAALFAYFWTNGGQLEAPFRLSGKVMSGVPKFSLPEFTIHATNQTTEITFMEIVSDLGISLLSVPLLAIFSNVSIAKAFGKY